MGSSKVNTKTQVNISYCVQNGLLSYINNMRCLHNFHLCLGRRGYQSYSIPSTEAVLCIKFLDNLIVSTSTVCFVSTATGFTTCKKRKRRNILADAIENDEKVDIQPDSPFGKGSNAELESRSEDPATSRRDGRFLLYWLTTTSTSTTTIFTATGTIATLACAPAGYTLSACG